ncbi:hypothetical protein Tco_1377445, partial [Tanacetum coccineum]
EDGDCTADGVCVQWDISSGGGEDEGDEIMLVVLMV